MKNYSVISPVMNNHDRIIEKFINSSTEDRFSQNKSKVSRDIQLAFKDRTSIKFTYIESEQSDSMFITIEKRYNPQTRYFENPNNLKNSKVIFLVDGRPVKCQNNVSHEFRIDTELQNSDSMKKILAISQITPFIEIATNAIYIEDFFKIALGNNLEIQISGENGIIAEYKLKDFETLWIKGYYNALFDESYMIKELLNSIEDAKKHFENHVDEIDDDEEDITNQIENYIHQNFKKDLLNINEITTEISKKFRLKNSIARAKVEGILVKKSYISANELKQHKKRASIVGGLIVIIAISSFLFMLYFNSNKK